MSSPAPFAVPPVSVIIPAFNAEQFLPRTIESVLGQSLPLHEVIVVDDGSADQTAKLARSFGSRVTCVSKQNGGPASARNYGIKAATGEWIAFVDADDQWLPNKLELQIALARKTGADVVSCDALLLDSRNASTSWMRHVKLRPRLDPFLGEMIVPHPFEMLLEIGCFLLPSMVMVKRACLMDAGLFDERFQAGEDFDLWLRLAMKYKIAIHPAPLITRQIHKGNVTGNVRRMLVEKIKVWENLKNQQSLSENKAWGKLVRKRAADDYRHLGFWYLRDQRFTDARECWLKSVSNSFSLSLTLLSLCTFMPSVLSTLQSIRRRHRSDGSSATFQQSSELKGRSH